ncbi:MAG TPA: DUF2630 family protein [Ktedonobacteraceae bacterium]|jgi:hypothetical protein|nr:DUF2630 family protein [Ktedonobacteraceae bacterium]
MKEQDIMQNIEVLVNEEHELLERKAAGPLGEEEHARLHQLEISLDQFWDLLRQRRARQHAGLNPDDALIRDPNTVENYRQ